jgi:uncharacterized membrane protein
MDKRPKIKLTLSLLDKRIEFASRIFLVAMWGLTIFAILKLPEIIPVHFNFSGQPDAYGNKLTLLTLPLLGTIIFWGLSRLNKYPHIFNYWVKITEENAHRQYTSATRVLRFLKLSVLIIFSMIIVQVYLAANGTIGKLGAWFLPAMFLLLLTPQIVLMIRSPKK